MFQEEPLNINKHYSHIRNIKKKHLVPKKWFGYHQSFNVQNVLLMLYYVQAYPDFSNYILTTGNYSQANPVLILQKNIYIRNKFRTFCGALPRS